MHPRSVNQAPSHKGHELDLGGLSEKPFAGRFGHTWKESAHNVYTYSARTEKGPVTPRIVSGWIEKLHCFMSCLAQITQEHDFRDTRENMGVTTRCLESKKVTSLQGEYDTAQASAKDNLYGSPFLVG